jgi:hypothetical protein
MTLRLPAHWREEAALAIAKAGDEANPSINPHRLSPKLWQSPNLPTKQPPRTTKNVIKTLTLLCKAQQTS